MSQRPGATAAPALRGKRLDAVLRAGIERKAKQEKHLLNEGNDTGVALLPSAGGGPLFVAQATPSLVDPGQVWRDNDLPVPGLYQDRKGFTPKQWAAQADLFTEKDSYNSVYTYSKGQGRAELKAMRTANGEGFFTGSTGRETMTAWIPTNAISPGDAASAKIVLEALRNGVDLDGEKGVRVKHRLTTSSNMPYITFRGGSRAFQTIDEFRLPLQEAINLGDDVPPQLKGSTTPLAAAITAHSQEIEHSILEWEYIARTLRVDDVSTETTTLSKKQDSGLQFSAHGLSYNPEAQDGVIFSGSAAVVFDNGQQQFFYNRARNGDLVLQPDFRGEESWEMPPVIAHKPYAELKYEDATRKEENKKDVFRTNMQAALATIAALGLFVTAVSRYTVPEALTEDEEAELQRRRADYLQKQTIADAAEAKHNGNGLHQKPNRSPAESTALAKLKKEADDATEAALNARDNVEALLNLSNLPAKATTKIMDGLTNAPLL